MALIAISLARRHARALAAAGVLALLAACGGGGGDSGDGGDIPPADPQAVQLEGASAATVTLGAAGGEISAAASDGRRYTLTVPAGALAADTVIMATPVRSMGNAPLAAGLKAAVRFGPSGLRFAVPARLRIEGAAAPTTAGKRLVGFVRADDGSTMNLQLPAQAAAALDLQVQHFSDAGVTEGSLAELALVPIVTPTSVADEIFEAATRELPPPADGAQALADVLAALHDRIVLRELDEATRADTPEARLVAATAFGIWDRAVELGTADDAQYAAVVALLGDRYVLSRARAGGFLKQDIDAGLAACAAPAPIGAAQQEGLKSALSLQAFAQQRGLDAADLGLDGDTVARRVNACARVAFVPQPAPAFTVGTAVSLDTQAEVIFAADANFRAAQPLAFTVGSSAASVATPEGPGDAAGRYTTVVTPSADAPQFDVKACLRVVVPVPVVFVPEGQLMASVMCGTQQVGGNAEVILAGRVSRNTETFDGSADLQVRFEGGSRFTVLQASGTWEERFGTTGQVPCATNTLSPRTITLPSTQRGRVNAALFLSPTGAVTLGSFGIGGPATVTSTTLSDPQSHCFTVTTNTEVPDSSWGVARILSIERDAAGVPAALVLGGDGATGRLERE